jgi:outer membrane protein assembly factor BamB/calcineurin-like phosphoesterase family protein
MKHKLFIFLLFFAVFKSLSAQKHFSFAHVTDIHIGNQTAEEDLRRTIRNINNDTTISFVILSGDITEFGSDEEIMLAKAILDSLNKPWYIIPGNHDSNWSESGSNTFKKVFGAESFHFTQHGFLFLGTASGPNMRMSPGQIPREHIVWLDSTLENRNDKEMPIIYINHYPQDSSLNNWYEAIDRLKKTNVQLILCGHGHSNRNLNFEGIPAVMGRSNLRAKNPEGGFNIITVNNGKATFKERNPVTNEEKQWNEVKLVQHQYSLDSLRYYRPSYAVNKQYNNVHIGWEYEDNSDIGSGTAYNKKYIFATNTSGAVYALDQKKGKKKWLFQTGGKIYATPAVQGNLLVVASTDNNIYGLNASTGKLVWKYETEKPIVANPVIKEGTIYIGSSDGHFRALDLNEGTLKWKFDGVKNFVVTKPLFYNGKIYFGSWGTEFYALDAGTGKMVWTWNNGHGSRMFSPAACYPVAANNRVFIVAPDRYMTALDAETGKVIWRKQDPKLRVRESMGLSADSTLVYAKTMDGQIIGVATTSDSMNVVWTAETNLGYELAPTAIIEKENIVYVPSDKGVVTAVNRKDGSILWKHKISNALVTGITPIGKNKVIVTTMDGKVTYIKYTKGK